MLRLGNIFLLLINLLIFVKILTVTEFFSPSRHQLDFDAYYVLVNDLLTHHNPYTVSHMQTLGPPSVFLYFLPFHFFTLSTSQNINLIINISSGYLTCLVLAIYAKKFAPRLSLLQLFFSLSILFYFSFLSRFSLQLGQPNLLITLLISLIITTPRYQATLLTALISLKTFFLISLISWLHLPSRLIRPLTYLFLLLTFTLTFIHPYWYFYYINNRLPHFNFQLVSTTSPLLNYENQTLNATLIRLHLSQFYDYTYLLIVIFALIFLYRHPSLELGLSFSYLLSPVLWQHYLIALFPLYLTSFIKSQKLLPRLLLLTSFIMWLPDLRLLFHPATLLNGLLASHFFFALCLLILVQIINLSRPHFRL